MRAATALLPSLASSAQHRQCVATSQLLLLPALLCASVAYPLYKSRPRSHNLTTAAPFSCCVHIQLALHRARSASQRVHYQPTTSESRLSPHTQDTSYNTTKTHTCIAQSTLKQSGCGPAKRTWRWHLLDLMLIMYSQHTVKHLDAHTVNIIQTLRL